MEDGVMAEDYAKLILKTMKVRCTGFQLLEKKVSGKRADYAFHIMDGSLLVSKEVHDADELVYNLQKTSWKGVPGRITIGIQEETRVEYVIAKKRIESAERKWCTYSHEIDADALAKKKLSHEETGKFLKEAYEALIDGGEGHGKS
jgi:hypothetical protein